MYEYTGPFFYHQLGHQDEGRCLHMLQNGQGVGAILSPRHLDDNQLREYAQLFIHTGGELLVDPQFYNPVFLDEFDDSPLGLGDYTTHDLWNSSVQHSVVGRILAYQRELGVSRLIVPTPFAREGVTESWLDLVAGMTTVAREWLITEGEDVPLLATLSVPAPITAAEDERARLLNRIVGFEVDGFYLALESSLFPADTDFLSGVLDMVFRLKQNRFTVLLGYSGYWAYLCFPFGLDAFASGGFDNRRSFSFLTWEIVESAPRRAPRNRFCSTRLLGRISFSDEAELLHSKDLWAALDDGSPYASILFEGRPPSEVDAAGQWKRAESFKHYLWTCWCLAESFLEKPRDDRIQQVRQLASEAQSRYLAFQQAGVRFRAGSQAGHIGAWVTAFENYLASVQPELEDEFV